MWHRTELIRSENLHRAGELIKLGRLVVFPTETVYGIGADAGNPDAVAAIFAAKRRPADNPLIVHIPALAELPVVASAVSTLEYALLESFAPGPFTLVLPRAAAIAPDVSAGLSTVAVRVPLNTVAQRFLAVAGRPVAAPSANRSGEPSPTSFAAARTAMSGRVAAIIDGGDCRYGIESTVVKVDSGRRRVVVLRPGSVTIEMITAALTELAVDATRSRSDPDHESWSSYRVCFAGDLGAGGDDAAAASPGTRHPHYQPRAPLYLLPGDRRELLCPNSFGCRVGMLLLESLPDRLHPTPLVKVFRDSEEYGRLLYRSFAWFDSVGCDAIIAQLPPAAGVGLAVRDRLTRAAGGRLVPLQPR